MDAQKWSARRGSTPINNVASSEDTPMLSSLPEPLSLSLLSDANINSQHLQITAARCRIDATIPPSRRYLFLFPLYVRMARHRVVFY